MNIKKHLVDHIFFYFIALAIIASVVVSYFRFMVWHDYLVSYEGNCDPATESCFIGCEDDECNTEYYYTQMQKYAPDLYAECGADITDCEKASICLSEDRGCLKTYCDIKINEEGCAYNPGESENQINKEGQVESSAEEILQNNLNNNI